MYAAKLSVIMFYTYKDPEESKQWMNRTEHFYKICLTRYGAEDQEELEKIGDKLEEMKKFEGGRRERRGYVTCRFCTDDSR
jgi:hypothetical protein